MQRKFPCFVIANRAQPGVAIQQDGLLRRRHLPASRKGNPFSFHRRTAFTLVEVLIGMSLALMVMTAVLSTYTTLGRNFTRTLGITSANQPTLNSQIRRTLVYFIQDVRMASGISGTPSASTVTLTLPSGTGTTTVAYSYDSTAQTLTRTPSGGTALVLQSSLLACSFTYYDAAGNSYTSFTNYLPGIKQLSLSFTCRAGSSTNGTLTQVYQADSPRMILRNRSFLP
jgi:hypothetical protein